LIAFPVPLCNQADQFANMNSGLNWMLLQPADDTEGTAIAFGAW